MLSTFGTGVGPISADRGMRGKAPGEKQSRSPEKASGSVHGAAAMGCNRWVAAHKATIPHRIGDGQRASSVGDVVSRWPVV
jgi:hypothetical protein